jgi:hypothetical protein
MRRRNTTCARPIDRSTIIAIENRGRHLIAGRKGMSCDPFLEMFFETSMIGNGQGETEIPVDPAKQVPRASKGF